MLLVCKVTCILHVACWGAGLELVAEAEAEAGSQGPVSAPTEHGVDEEMQEVVGEARGPDLDRGGASSRGLGADSETAEEDEYGKNRRGQVYESPQS